MRAATAAAPLVLELAALPEAVGEVRRAVRRRFGGGGPVDEVQLCVSELLGNVIRHVGVGTPVTVRIAEADGGRVRVEVGDSDPGALPYLVRAADEDESGRGMALLDAVALRWGVRQGVGGKTVWCELPAPCR